MDLSRCGKNWGNPKFKSWATTRGSDSRSVGQERTEEALPITTGNLGGLGQNEERETGAEEGSGRGGSPRVNARGLGLDTIPSEKGKVVMVWLCCVCS
jgi:hypothetical protein